MSDLQAPVQNDILLQSQQKKTIVKVQTMSTDQAPMPHKLITIMAPGHICDAVVAMCKRKMKRKEKQKICQHIYLNTEMCPKIYEMNNLLDTNMKETFI